MISAVDSSGANSTCCSGIKLGNSDKLSLLPKQSWNRNLLMVSHAVACLVTLETNPHSQRQLGRKPSSRHPDLVIVVAICVDTCKHLSQLFKLFSKWFENRQARKVWYYNSNYLCRMLVVVSFMCDVYWWQCGAGSGVLILWWMLSALLLLLLAAIARITVSWPVAQCTVSQHTGTDIEIVINQSVIRVLEDNQTEVKSQLVSDSNKQEKCCPCLLGRSETVVTPASRSDPPALHNHWDKWYGDTRGQAGHIHGPQPFPHFCRDHL